ncbi:hypothetical protein BDR22DRAFT_842986 [Usnea florida]
MPSDSHGLWNHFRSHASMYLVLFAIAASLYTASTLPLSQGIPSSPLAPVIPVHNFSAGTWVENLYVRRTGDILVTLVTPDSAVYQIKPQTGEAYLVTTIPGVTSVSGIAEGLDDIFYVNALSLSLGDVQGVPGSNAVWELDLRGAEPPFSKAQIELRLAVEVPKARILNGLTAFDIERGLYFTADYQGGVIYRIDVKTGTANVALANNFTAPGEAGGVNGLEVHGSYLYWTSNGASVFARVPINNDGVPTGPTEVILQNFPSDDFTFDRRGNVYLVDNTTAIAVLREDSSKAEEVASGITNPTAVRFGRVPSDSNVLYVSSRGDPSVPGGLSKIDLSSRK